MREPAPSSPEPSSAVTGMGSNGTSTSDSSPSSDTTSMWPLHQQKPWPRLTNTRGIDMPRRVWLLILCATMMNMRAPLKSSRASALMTHTAAAAEAIQARSDRPTSAIELPWTALPSMNNGAPSWVPYRYGTVPGTGYRLDGCEVRLCVRVCACVSRVCPGSPRCLFTGTGGFEGERVVLNSCAGHALC